MGKTYEAIREYIGANPGAAFYQRYFHRATANGKNPCAFLLAQSEQSSTLYPGGYVFVVITPNSGKITETKYRVTVADNAGLEIRTEPNDYETALTEFAAIKAMGDFSLANALTRFKMA